MIVDDSVIVRSIISRILKDENHIEVVSFASNGQDAIDQSRYSKPDVILLDLEMPVMDGISAIPALVHDNPHIRIILCSALSEKGADITLKGLSLGAADFILKPSALTGNLNKERFRDQLVEKISHISAKRNSDPAASGKKDETQGLSLRPLSAPMTKPSIIAIGCSTGGPNALTDFFRSLKRPSVPIVITQHMPKTFTRILAEQLAKTGDTPCLEGEHGMEVIPGYAYVAPGDRHMLFRQEKGRIYINLDSGPAENFCRPAVDPMLRSLIGIFSSHITAIILTGMGADGLEGCRQIVSAGGHVLAQDEGSSAVWGMPGAVAKAGLCSEVDTVPNLAKRVQFLMDLP